MSLKILEMENDKLREDCIDKESALELSLHNQEVSNLRQLVASHLLVLQKWVCFSSHKILEAKINQDDNVMKIKKSFINDPKNKSIKSAKSNFKINYQNGVREEFTDWTLSVEELVEEAKYVQLEIAWHLQQQFIMRKKVTTLLGRSLKHV